MSALSITISDISIRQDSYSRYCLNDLHKASGNNQKHRPKYWLENQQTKDLIAEIEIGGIPPIQSKQGFGTFVVKELVYAYAMWISAKFHLEVIRAYDALTTNPEPIHLTHCTKEQREPLVKAVRRLVATATAKGKSITYEEAHSIVNLQIGINSVEELTLDELPNALKIVGNLLQKVILEGEYIARGEPEKIAQPEPITPDYISTNDDRNIRNLIWQISHSMRYEQSWIQGAWFAIRKSTGVKSPYPLETKHLPVVATELTRILGIATKLSTFMSKIEKEVVKEALREGADIDDVIAKKELEVSTFLKEIGDKIKLDSWDKKQIDALLLREPHHYDRSSTAESASLQA